ncbi:hypothetical protein [Mycolicibacterium sphagni]|uniref:Uncharacterized protein n=1 Tax=Mycolicibacterium sphagni TaxID=1786 RepID=A0ABX2JNL5_9MYCO|nr:hypothetical protein [Mycolicibacterium sphagni]NTY58339.1 hypothetical protein [Mycolicibacterium sphagni]
MAGKDGGTSHIAAAFAVIIIASAEQIWGLPVLTPGIEVATSSADVTGQTVDEPVRITVVELWGMSPSGEADFGQAAAVAASLGQPKPHTSTFLRTVRRSVRMIGMPVPAIVKR